VTVRAVASLPELIELAFPLLRVGGRLVAWKREPLAEELIAGRNAARALGGEVEVREVPVRALAERRLIVVTKLRPTPRRYPRSPAERRSRPL
jgi:16S rRNA (guanine527-N7)-methyltransferase